MNKNSIIKVFGALLLTAGFVSCDDDDQNFPDPAAKPVITVSQSATTSAEGNDGAVTVTLTLDKAYYRAIDLKLEFVNDEEFEDLAFTGAGNPLTIENGGLDQGWGDLPAYGIIFPANRTSYSFTVRMPDNGVYQADKTYQLKLSTEGNLNGVFTTGEEATFSVTFTNTVSSDLNLVFDWDQTFDVAGETYSLCELEYDVDILVYDSDGNPYGDGAQTAGCPEELTMSFEDYPDGTYTITGYLWENQGLSGAGISPALNFPATVTYTRGGSQSLGSGTFVQNNFLTSDSASGEEVYIMDVVVAGGTYTIQDSGTVIASGRQHAKKMKKK